MLEYRSLVAGTIPADCDFEGCSYKDWSGPARLWALRDQRSQGVREKVMGKLKMGVMQMVEAARAEIEEVEASDAIKEAGDPDCLVIDIRDIRERKRDGYIPDSFHCPRGMIEFWVDPDSPYFKEIFDEKKRFLFHCAADWRSALTVQTVTRMGMENTAHIKGGLKGWREAGGPFTKDEG